MDKYLGQVPRFKHDCDTCRFLGQYEGQDLYVHVGQKDHQNTVIARFGNDGPEYSSGMGFSFGSSEELTQARLRAQQAGLLAYPFGTAASALHSQSPQEQLEEFRQAASQHPQGQFLLQASKRQVSLEEYEAAFAQYLAEVRGKDSGFTETQVFQWWTQHIRRVLELVLTDPEVLRERWYALFEHEEVLESRLFQAANAGESEF